MSVELSDLNKRMKELRKALKISQRKIANDIGVKQSYYSDVENGRRNLTEKISEGLENKYYVNKEWLYTGIGKMFTPKSNQNSTLNPVPDAYPNEQKEQKNEDKDKWDYWYMFSQHIKEQHPEFDQLMKDIIEVSNLEDLIDGFQRSMIGRSLHLIIDNKTFKNFTEFKNIGIQHFKEVQPYKDVVHEYAEATRKFIRQLREIKDKINLDFDFEDYYQEESEGMNE